MYQPRAGTVPWDLHRPVMAALQTPKPQSAANNEKNDEYDGGSTMKKDSVKRLGMAALALTLITTCLMGGTLAKYTSSVNGTGTVAVAKWSFKAGEGTNAAKTDAFTFSLADTKDANVSVSSSKVAPGDKGKVSIKVDASGSEVGVNYTIKVDGLSTTNDVVKFYSDSAYTTAIPADGYTGTIALADVDTAATTDIYWKWVTASANGDAADTTIGESAPSETFTVTVTGTQADAAAPAPTS